MTHAITVKKRTEDAAAVRAAGFVPGIVYGAERKPVSIQIAYNELDKLYQQAGESTLIDLTIENETPAKVLIADTQLDPVKNRMIHVDFRQINMSQEMNATITLNFVGESSAVKEGGTLIIGSDTITIKCLPRDLVSSIDIDLSQITAFDDAIHAGDIALPPGMALIDHAEQIIANVKAPLSEDQFKALEESQSGDVTAVAVEGEKKEGDDETKSKEKESEKNDQA